jgi:monoamine oxidase
MTEQLEADVAIVGAGLAGLVAARQLVAAGVRPVVLEARDRVGGRLLNHEIGDGKIVEVGGQWIGPTQDRIAALAAELGVGTFPTYDEGRDVLEMGGKRTTFTDFNDIGVGLLRDLSKVMSPLALMDFEQARVRLDRMAKRVPLEAPWQAPKARLWDGQTCRIAYDPPLPALRDQLTQRMPQGSVIKTMAIYEEPFWRREGLSGQGTSDAGPARVTFDNSPPDGSPGVLLGFLEGRFARHWATRPAAERREAILAGHARLFGPRAAEPVDFVERIWAEEEWTRGCYGCLMTTGGWTEYGRALREPVGCLHWAGAETATVWNGYMDGAVSSGERAAGEVLAQIR